MIQISKPLFPLGQVVATKGVSEALEKAKTSAWDLLRRHVAGDFGEVDQEDWQANLEAIKDDARVLSAYTVADERLWVITEADRSSTCVLLVSEY